MRFLVDALLPPALARWLEQAGHEAWHVADVGLLSSPDSEVWAFAESRRAVVVTKDQDFFELAAWRAQGPQVLWVRIGNCTRAELIRAFECVLLAAVRALQAGEQIVEIL